ncbi:thiol-disulfide oxidoreductase [Bacillus sp. MUM 116]|uniref:thiol-disulfide oxidoreductase DCC family protein n=1 Tax=Bacillus sp. MUM 116 TaxID=1678002 RepID=UPI0008F55FB1|nr:thiol-disulfide oxidoreductase DCC family protein [Bacillus sp. MUM 116]OIK15681.1 thiol-disulfide oxidoreductase [Bacillus sp. MUM 116]
MERIVLFDGVCNLCNQSVQFIIKRDPSGIFKFASLQGERGKRIISDFGIPAELESLILIENEKAYRKSTAALRICGKLNGPWKLFVILMIIPPFIRDYIYDIIAKNRYKWFGRKNSCMLPSPSLKNRFLD